MSGLSIAERNALERSDLAGDPAGCPSCGAPPAEVGRDLGRATLAAVSPHFSRPTVEVPCGCSRCGALWAETYALVAAGPAAPTRTKVVRPGGGPGGAA